MRRWALVEGKEDKRRSGVRLTVNLNYRTRPTVCMKKGRGKRMRIDGKRYTRERKRVGPNSGSGREQEQGEGRVGPAGLTSGRHFVFVSRVLLHNPLPSVFPFLTLCFVPFTSQKDGLRDSQLVVMASEAKARSVPYRSSKEQKKYSDLTRLRVVASG